MLQIAAISADVTVEIEHQSDALCWRQVACWYVRLLNALLEFLLCVLRYHIYHFSPMSSFHKPGFFLMKSCISA